MLWCSVYQWAATLLTPLHYSHLRWVTLDLHTLFLSQLRALMMKDEGWSNESVPHTPTPIAILRSSLIWLPDKYGPEEQQQFAFKGCSSYMPHACNSLKGTFAFWMPENAQKLRRGNQGAKIFWIYIGLLLVITKKKPRHVRFKFTKFEEKTGHI